MSSSTSTSLNQTLVADVQAGLSGQPKRLSSKYFYDDRGSELFREIMRMDTYYPTDCEYEIFKQHTARIQQAFSPEGQPFQLVEFGAGDGHKTKVLLEYFQREKLPFTYMPIDISKGAIDRLAGDLKRQWPQLNFEPVIGEYFEALHRINQQAGDQPKVILFLGSNIGNFIEDQAVAFLKALRREMNPGDRVLIGFDLKKDPKVILPAYSDPWGITRAFNLNLLTRLNRELGANFDVEQWDHYATYHPINGETRSYLLSKKDQEVFFEKLNCGYHFDAWEPIWTELSQKYDLHMVKRLAQLSGFKIVDNLFDSHRYFLDSIWEYQ